FFFSSRRRHTRVSRDWSSDVCSSDLVADVHFIATAEVAGWPLLGALSKLQRTVFVERDARRRSGAQVDAIAARLADGDPMVLFRAEERRVGNRVGRGPRCLMIRELRS